MAKLGEVCTIVSGSTPKTSVTSYWDGNIKWITPAELNEDTFYIMDSVRHITEEGKEKTGLSYLPTGTVILSSRAPIGKTAIAGCEMCCNQGFKNLICSDAIYNEYLYFFLKSKTDYLNSLGRGATFKEISKSIVESIEIPLPEVNQQKEIAEKFKKLEQLISLRKQQLAKLDELVKARFVEMFGNPIENTMNWPKKLLRDITTKIGSGATPKGGRESYPNAGVSLIRSMNVYDGQFLYKDLAHLTDEQATQLNGVTVEAEDVLVNITGASVARSCVVPKDVLPARVNQHVAIVRCNRELLNPIFTNKMFINNEFKKALLSIGESGGATRQAITKKQLEELSVVVPPLSIQNEFFTFSECVDQQKQTVQQSLDKLELMKKALMQEYFG